MELTKPSGLVSQSVCMSPLVSTPTTQWCRHLPLRCRHHHSVGVNTSVNTSVDTVVDTSVKTNNSLSEIGVDTNLR